MNFGYCRNCGTALTKTFRFKTLYCSKRCKVSFCQKKRLKLIGKPIESRIMGDIKHRLAKEQSKPIKVDNRYY